jgi:hypothetical protein
MEEGGSKKEVDVLPGISFILPGMIFLPQQFLSFLYNGFCWFCTLGYGGLGRQCMLWFPFYLMSAMKKSGKKDGCCDCICVVSGLDRMHVIFLDRVHGLESTWL